MKREEQKPTGIELIAQERKEQIEKHGYTEELTKNNPKWYRDHQLARVAGLLTHPEGLEELTKMHPMEMAIDMHLIEHWNEDKLRYMAGKSYKDRLIIAGALIAAEIDRINAMEP